MKRTLFTIIMLVLIGLVSGKSYYVSNFTSDIYVNDDGSLNVHETFDYVLEGGPFRWVRREVVAPNKGFNLLKKCKIDGEEVPITGQVGGISYKRSKRLDVKYHMNKVYDRNVKFEVEYYVGNAIKQLGGKAVLDWKLLRRKQDFLIQKGLVRVHIPKHIDMFDVVNFSDDRKGIYVEEKGHVVEHAFTNFKKKNLRILIHLPLEEISLIKQPLPRALKSQSQLDPQMKKYSRGYAIAVVVLVLYMFVLIIFLITKSYKNSKNLPQLTQLPEKLNPALVARIRQLGANELNLIPVLMQMAIKKLITFTQKEKANGKKVKDYWVDINEDTSHADKFDQAYLELLRAEEKRKNKRIELKTLINNSYRYNKMVKPFLKEEFLQ
jgi:hypothetical protein